MISAGTAGYRAGQYLIDVEHMQHRRRRLRLPVCGASHRKSIHALPPVRFSTALNEIICAPSIVIVPLPSLVIAHIVSSFWPCIVCIPAIPAAVIVPTLSDGRPQIQHVAKIQYQRARYALLNVLPCNRILLPAVNVSVVAVAGFHDHIHVIINCDVLCAIARRCCKCGLSLHLP